MNVRRLAFLIRAPISPRSTPATTRAVAQPTKASPTRAKSLGNGPPLLALQFHVLIRGRERIAGDVAKPRVANSRAHAPKSADLPYRGEHRLVVDELLDSLQDRRAPLRVHLACLLAEQSVDVAVTPVDVRAARSHERLDPCCCVDEGTASALDEVPVLFLRVPLEEGDPLDWPELRADADRFEVVDHGFREAGERRVAEILACVK